MNFVKKLLSMNEKNWTFSLGESKIIRDKILTPYNFCPDKMKKWRVENENIITYYVRPSSVFGSSLNEYDHIFTGINLGTTFVTCKETMRKYPVVVIGSTSPMNSYFYRNKKLLMK